MLKNNIIVFPHKLYQILSSLLVWSACKMTHLILESISEYKKCDLYESIYVLKKVVA